MRFGLILPFSKSFGMITGIPVSEYSEAVSWLPKGPV